jgi:hypothetical protein
MSARNDVLAAMSGVKAETNVPTIPMLGSAIPASSNEQSREERDAALLRRRLSMHPDQALFSSIVRRARK